MTMPVQTDSDLNPSTTPFKDFLVFAGVCGLIGLTILGIRWVFFPPKPIPQKDPTNFVINHDDGFMTVVLCESGRDPTQPLDIQSGVGLADCAHGEIGILQIKR